MNAPPGKEPYHDTIYDWNLVDSYQQVHQKTVALHDETLRDGLQSAYVRHPSTERKLDLIRLMDSLGIDSVDLGLPGASPHAKTECMALARAIADEKMRIRPCVAARTHLDDVRPSLEVAQHAGIPVELMVFIGSSPIRMLAEEWDLQFLLTRSHQAIRAARDAGMPVTLATEDTTRSRPDVLYRLFVNAVDAGTDRLCICDTVGHAMPDGIRVLMRFVQDLVKGLGADVKVDWHGHNDRGIALSNALWAVTWGADRLHGCALGVGERAGNTSMDRLIMNLRLMGIIDADRDLSRLLEYCDVASDILGFPVPWNYPLAGRDVFRTQTGVHAAAIIKARRKGDDYLADRIYSGVPAGMFGRRQEICVGPMSGTSNVMQVLADRGLEPTDDRVQALLRRAKSEDRILGDEDIAQTIAAADLVRAASV
jgi:2-isopropylmalate synthase